ncbi:hypothetical protein [Actinoplanes sp. NBRC 103695]|uniref:hypothetical protein n=1 Tax=Actinoplanes sp. NBRC 103695 TaxID=3032202 RepID=UPI0024A23EC7|nr:hypothetical protein [Actinoplanes sp. NBRC 103695]GLY93578.1 glycosyl transferase [Actinoplanes sp. NBRC 103695]
MQAVDEASAELSPGPRASRGELLAWLSYPVLAVIVLIQLWANPSGRVLSANDDDHGFFLFVVAHGERVLFHGDNPFFTGRLNVPDGVNIMANTTVLALTLPVAPITHFLGPAVSVVLLLTLGLAGTAAAWYWVFSRHLVTSRLAAWIGGLWCGFCPAMVSHANGHINFVSQFVVPFIVWQVLRLREPGRAVRGGVTLGLLIVLQVFINEEVLLFTALTLGVFVIAYAAMARTEARAVAGRVAAGLGVAAVTAGVLLIYPLWWQFSGPSSYKGQPFTPGEYVTDLLSLGAYARQSLAGNTRLADILTVSATEENTFFGLPLLVLLVIGMRLVWRSVAARAAGIAALVLLLVSMGPHLRAAGTDTSVPLPFGLVSHLPIIDLVSVTRFAMVTATIVGVLLALIVDRGVRLTGRSRRWFLIGLVVALVPVLPKPLPTVAATPLPPFISAGMWRDYVTDDRSLVPVPLPEVTTGREAMRWAALSHLEFRVPRGYFMGPADPPGNLTGSWNAPHRPTSVLLWRVRENGQIPALTDADRSAAVADLTYWRAAIVVLVPESRNVDALGVTLTQLLGREPQRVGGVLLWDVRDIPVPPLE